MTYKEDFLFAVIVTLIITTVIVLGSFCISYDNTPSSIDVEILEISYLQGTFSATAKTIIRCHSETYIFEDIHLIPLGNVTITYVTPRNDGVSIIKEWVRRE